PRQDRVLIGLRKCADNPGAPPNLGNAFRIVESAVRAARSSGKADLHHSYDLAIRRPRHVPSARLPSRRILGVGLILRNVHSLSESGADVPAALHLDWALHGGLLRYRS